MKTIENYNSINNDMREYYSEFNKEEKKKIGEKISQRYSAYEILQYKMIKSNYTYKININDFLEIYNLSQVLETFSQMESMGEKLDFNSFMGNLLIIKNKEDINDIGEYIKEGKNLDLLKRFEVIIKTPQIFSDRNIDQIYKNIPQARVYIDREKLDELLKIETSNKNDIRVMLNIDNIAQLPLDKFINLKNRFNIKGIKIYDSLYGNQGEKDVISIDDYERINNIIKDEIISKIFINKNNNNKDMEDWAILSQIAFLLSNKLQYDEKSEKEGDMRNEDLRQNSSLSKGLKQASSINCLLNGKAICKGYAEAFRNIAAYFNIQCPVIESDNHAWNLVRIGNDYYNMDLTWAKPQLDKNEPSAYLFMNDELFYGQKRKVNINGTNLIVGGHEKKYAAKKIVCDKYFAAPATIIKFKKGIENCVKNYQQNNKSSWIPCYESTRFSLLKNAIQLGKETLEEQKNTQFLDEIEAQENHIKTIQRNNSVLK